MSAGLVVSLTTALAGSGFMQVSAGLVVSLATALAG